MRFLTSLLLLVWLSSCSYLPSFDDEELPPPSPGMDTAEITAVIQDWAADLLHDRRLVLQHAKTYYEDGIRTLSLEFLSEDIIEMCEARYTIVDISEALLARLNQDPILGPQFVEYPFSATNLEIYITYDSFFGKHVDPHYITWIGMEDGDIWYFTFDLLDNDKNCWHARHETYATSREIVVYQKQAEKRYAEDHPSGLDVFGSLRYFPKK